MRVGQLAPGRPAWYDRNPQTVVQAFEGIDTSPHAQIVRWTYTVPTGKKAWVDSAHILLFRRTAAGAEDLASVFLTITPSGGSLKRWINILELDNTVGAREHVSLGSIGVMQAGDIIAAYTADYSTGGAHDLHALAKITEFDA